MAKKRTPKMKTAKKVVNKTTKKTTKKVAKKTTGKSAAKSLVKPAKKTTKKTAKKITAKKSMKPAGMKKKTSAAKKVTKKSKKSVTEVMREILEQQQAHHNPIQAELLGEEVASSEDPSKAPGHRNLDVKGTSAANPAESARSENARQNLTRADKVNRATTAQRRIITGAAVGKTGRIVNK